MTKKRSLYLIVTIFVILYALISLVNHYMFRTSALDLGAYTNALYDYANFQWNDSTAFKTEPENLLADHFDLYLIILSPLVWIFGTYTLLIAQITAIGAGAIGVFKFFENRFPTQSISLFAAANFCAFFGVFAAVSFDYHSNVIAACLVPWFFYHIEKENNILSLVFFILILISKENVSFWMTFVCLGLLIEHFKNRKLRKALLFYTVGSFVYFILIIKVVMPAISNAGAYPHFHYSTLGHDFGEAFIYLISHPIDAVTTFFTNHTDHPHGDYVKLETHVLLLISGLPFLFFKPQYLIMIIPVYFQKMFHDNHLMWGIGGQYSIEFAPILAIGIFMVLAQLKSKKKRRITSFIVLTLTIAATIRSMDNTVLYTNKAALRFYQADHYKRDYDVAALHKKLNEIPENAVISAQSPFLPHLSLRDDIYLFPTIKDAEYIIFAPDENPYPITKEELQKITLQLTNSKDWEIQYDKAVKIFRRNK